MLNRVILMGRITHELELKTTASGVLVTSFSIAVDRNYVRQGEERQTDFINIVCWRQQAEFVCRYFQRGSMIALEGRIQSRTYKAKDGTNRYVTEVVADSISFTGEKRVNSGNNGYGNNNGYNNQSQNQAPPQQAYNQAPAQQQQSSYSNGSPSDFEEMPLDDDLLF